jgi:hypothetical protein
MPLFTASRQGKDCQQQGGRQPVNSCRTMGLHFVLLEKLDISPGEGLQAKKTTGGDPCGSHSFFLYHFKALQGNR